VRMPIAQYLRDCGYKVIEAVDADEAMVVLLYRETVLDVVFSNLEMPGSVDGLAWRGETDTQASSRSGRNSSGHRAACGRTRKRIVRSRFRAEAL